MKTQEKSYYFLKIFEIFTKLSHKTICIFFFFEEDHMHMMHHYFKFYCLSMIKLNQWTIFY